MSIPDYISKVEFEDLRKNQYGRTRTGEAWRASSGWHGRYYDEPDLTYFFYTDKLQNDRLFRVSFN